MKNAGEVNMEIQKTPSTTQAEQSPTEKSSCQRLEHIGEERNRLVRSVSQQPTDVLRDMAVLAVGWGSLEFRPNIACGYPLLAEVLQAIVTFIKRQDARDTAAHILTTLGL